MTDEALGASEEIISSLGHNQPPSEREEALERQAEVLARFEKRRDEFIAAANAGVVRDRDSAGQAADVIRLARQVRDDIETETAKIRRPFRETAELLKHRVDEFWGAAETALEALAQRAKQWKREEDVRIAAQAREQAAALGDLAPTAAPPRARKVRGDYGGQIVDREVFEYSIEDPRQLPVELITAAPVAAAIATVVRGIVAAGLAVPPGIKAVPVSRTDFR